MVENHENARRHQYRKSRQPHARSDEPCPRTQGQAHQAHSFSAKIKRGRDEVQRAQELAHAKQPNGNHPKDNTQPLARPRNRTHRIERCVLGPAPESRPIAQNERRHEDDEGHESDPERHHIESRKRHVLRTNLDGKKEIPERRERRRRQHKENHDGAMHGHQLQVVLWRHLPAGSAILRKQLQARDWSAGPR